MRDMTRMHLESAMTHALTIVREATNAAADADAAADRDPELAARLEVIAAQMYAVADVARDAERELARLHAERRARAGGDR